MNEAQTLTLEMVRAASITQSQGERDFPHLLRELILREPHFQHNPDHVRVTSISDDPFERANLIAFVKGSGKRSVLLTGHFDVVSTSNYGPLEPWAFEPEQLRAKLIADLCQNARSDAEKLALQDLESGEFIPGRGLLDMKAGLGAGLLTLYRFARSDERRGNIIFLAVADEEVQSHGARGAIAQLEQLCAEQHLEIETVINLDATSDNSDGSEGQAVYWGSVGKLLVSNHVVGIETHAGYPFTGINPNFLLAQIAAAIECNPQLADHAQSEIAPPPTTLKQTDLKTHYDVTTPARAWAIFNVLTHGKSAMRVLEEFKHQTTLALEGALNTLRERASIWGTHAAALEVQPLVLGFHELLEQTRARQGEKFEDQLAEFTASLDPKLDAPSTACQITDFVWTKSELIGPAVVLGFAALHYPAVHLEDAAVLERVRDALRNAQSELGIRIKERHFFAGISDMSWFGQTDPADLAVVNHNTPNPKARITSSPLGKPTINLGPWGRDYHQRLERAHVRYSFEELPELVWRVTDAILSGGPTRT